MTPPKAGDSCPVVDNGTATESINFDVVVAAEVVVESVD